MRRSMYKITRSSIVLSNKIKGDLKILKTPSLPKVDAYTESYIIRNFILSDETFQLLPFQSYSLSQSRATAYTIMIELRAMKERRRIKKKGKNIGRGIIDETERGE